MVVLDTQRQTHQVIAVVLLAPEGQIAPRRGVAERLLPVNGAHGGLDLGGGHAARIQAADHGAHAGARDAVDRDFQLLQDLEHADVRHSARAAAGQYQANPRPLGRPGRMRGHREDQQQL